MTRRSRLQIQLGFEDFRICKIDGEKARIHCIRECSDRVCRIAVIILLQPDSDVDTGSCHSDLTRYLRIGSLRERGRGDSDI